MTASRVLGALRNGGFDEASINAHDPMRLTYIRNSFGEISTRPKVGVLATPRAGEVGAHGHPHHDHRLARLGHCLGQRRERHRCRTAVTLGCASCHNPHGNGQYRILNPVPRGERDPPGPRSASNTATTMTHHLGEHVFTTASVRRSRKTYTVATY